MEKININIAKLLEDCPKGMEFDCILFNSPIALEGVADESTYPIRAVSKDGFHLAFTKYGMLYDCDDAKCVIFPKGKTTWEGFQRPFKRDIKSGKYYLCIRNLFDELDNIIFHKGDTYYSPEDGKLIPSNSNIP